MERPPGDPRLGREIGGCRVVERLGEGAMSAVYRAQRLSDGAELALKLLLPGVAHNQRLVQFFLREARSVIGLNHPNIVRVLSSGQEGGEYFLVMELVRGPTLRDLLHREGKLPWRRANKLMTDVLRGLDAAHSREIVHRDIKPSNILLAEDGRALLADFGMARAVHEDKKLTLTGEVIGTPYYLAPEQALGKPVDGRTDLYGVGATYYHLLAGRPPFDGENPVDVIQHHLRSPVAPVTKHNPDVPEALWRLIDRMLRKSPDDRFPSAKAALAEFLALGTGEAEAPPRLAEEGVVFTGFFEDTGPPSFPGAPAKSKTPLPTLEREAEPAPPPEPEPVPVPAAGAAEPEKRPALTPLPTDILRKTYRRLPPAAWAAVAALWLVALGLAAWLAAAPAP